MSFFVTGSDTNVGKSYICRALAFEFAKSGKKTGYLKPFQSGIEEGVNSDEKQVLTFAPNTVVKSSYVTKTPCTPRISAQIDGVKYDLNKIKNDFEKLNKMCDITIVEGSGGLYVPVEKNVLMSDVIKFLNLPAIIVVRPNLGTINHTLMTIKCAQNEGIRVLGVVISNYPKNTSDPAILRAKEMIEDYSNIKVLDIIFENQSNLSNLAKMII